MESKSHEHCDNCVKLYCSSQNGCKMLFCEFGCTAQLHSCKMKDHQNVCQKCRIPCINSEYGCPVVMTRDSLRNHLQRCPASVIFCTMEWNRYPVYSKSRLSLVPFFQPNPILVKGHLDVELAFRDQRILQEVFRRRCRKGKAKVDMLRSSLQKGTPKQHGSGTQPSTVKSDSVKMAMALAMSSLENKFRKQRGFLAEISRMKIHLTTKPITKTEIFSAICFLEVKNWKMKVLIMLILMLTQLI